MTISIPASTSGSGGAAVRPALVEGDLDGGFAHHFARVVGSYGDRLAVCTQTVHWTYSEVDAISNRVARAVVERLGPGVEPVALLMEHDAPLLAAIVGVLKAGRVYVSLDPGNPDVRITTELGDFQPKLILTDAANGSRAQRLAASTASISGAGGAIVDVEALSGPSAPVDVPVTADTPAYIMSTSGSTGGPKGVVHSHGGLLWHARNYIQTAGFSPGQRVSLLTSTSLGASASNLFAALLSGATLCPYAARREGLGGLAAWLEREAITILHLAPPVYRQLMSDLAGPGRSRIGALRFLRLGGDAAYAGDFALFRTHAPAPCTLMVGLSSTETGLIRFTLLGAEDRLDPSLQLIPLRQQHSGVELLLVDEDGRPVPPGEVGRIWVRSPALALGYWNRDDLTSQLFQRDLTHPEMRVFKSNDLGRLLPDGSLECRGRQDDQVKIRGFRVGLGEVEAALHTLPCVKEAAVIAVTEGAGGRKLAAYVVPQPDAPFLPAQLRTALSAMVPQQMVPPIFVHMAALPRTPAGKIDRHALPAPVEQSAVADGDRPRNPVEARVAAIWAAAMGREEISVHQTFLDAGGDSLQAVGILAGIAAQFGVNLPISTFLSAPTIEKLAEALAAAAPPRRALHFLGHGLWRKRHCDSMLVPFRVTGTRRPLFCVHGLDLTFLAMLRLTRHLPPDRPIYGLEWPGMAGDCLPPHTLSALVAMCIEQVRRIDPTGPYFLAGICLGGPVALEMARQLRHDGREVKLVVMIESPYVASHSPRFGLRRRVTDAVRDFVRDQRWRVRLAFDRRPQTLAKYRDYIRHAIRGPLRRHKIEPSDLPVTLVQSAQRQADPAHPLNTLRKALGERVRVIEVPGDHLSCFVPPHVEVLAAELEKLMEGVEKGGEIAPLPPGEGGVYSRRVRAWK